MIRFRMPKTWLVGFKSRGRYLQPNLIVRNPAVGNDKFVLRFVKKILSSLLFIADLEAPHKGVDKKQLAKDWAQEVIDYLFFGHRNSWGPCNGSHDNYDVTFEIPIGWEGGETLIISSK